MSDRPIGPYVRDGTAVLPHDPASAAVARRVAELVVAGRPGLTVEHVGSTAVPGLPGKGVVDLAAEADPADIPAITAALHELGFQPQSGPDPWPPTRPMVVGGLVHEGRQYAIHLHVHPRGGDFGRDLAFRDALRADRRLRDAYAALKSEIVGVGRAGLEYTYSKQAWIADAYRTLGIDRPAIEPPATIGILGGGQLGRMLGLAARAMGYRIVVLDPDPDCPAAAVADRVIVATYDDVEAARGLVGEADVVTYELEHVAIEIVEALDAIVPVRPGPYPLRVSGDRIAERRFVEASGASVAPWREVRTEDELRGAARALGTPLRLKSASGGYDGRSQVRIGSPAELDGALARLGRPAGTSLLAERELDFTAELSVVVSRDTDGHTAAYPPVRNVHDAGILIESVAPAPVEAAVAGAATGIGLRLATAMGLAGTLTVELFLLDDGSLVVNELAPRVHNSGHWTIEGAATSQFEQHIRAICGLPLGSTEMTAPAAATVNLLGTGPERAARVRGVGAALADPAVHLHVYDKRRVFERRKMGHLTVLGSSVEEALERGRSARAALAWADGPAEAEVAR